MPDVRVEGMPHCDWVLIDAGDVIVHVFRPEVRAFYNLEKMWAAEHARAAVEDAADAPGWADGHAARRRRGRPPEARSGARARRALPQARRAGRAAASASATSKSSKSAKAAPQDVGRRMIEESIALANVIPDRAGIVLLDERGDNLDSAALAAQLQRWRDDGRPAAVFVIGGADGLAPSLRDKATLRLAFGAATWPHQLVRIMLLEQLYRAVTILSGHPYHRA